MLPVERETYTNIHDVELRKELAEKIAGAA